MITQLRDRRTQLLADIKTFVQRRADVNEAIKDARAELAKVERFLAADKPRTRRSAP